jgi:hypothetical protein
MIKISVYPIVAGQSLAPYRLLPGHLPPRWIGGSS